MRKSILVSTLFISLFVSLNASAEGVFPTPRIGENETLTLFTNSEFEFNLINHAQMYLFTSIQYNNRKERLSFETKLPILLIQIYNEVGDLELQLPVGSDVVHLSKNLFNSGEYNMKFLFEGEKDFQSTELTVN